MTQFRLPGNTFAMRAAGSAAVYGLSHILIQSCGMVSGVILARLLSPSEFGMYGVVAFLYGLFFAVGDLGLSAGLIRQNREPTDCECRTVFFVRQVVDLCWVVLLLAGRKLLGDAYHLPPGEETVFPLIGIALFINSFQLIPSVLLERRLGFAKVGLIEGMQVVVGLIVTILLCWLGWGIVSFGWGWIAFAISGVLLINRVQSWTIRWSFDLEIFRTLLAFGLPFQGGNFLMLLRDSLIPLVIGISIGTAAVGYINLALMIAGFATVGLAILQRIWLPLFARYQTDKDKLGEIMNQVLFVANLLTAPITVLLVVLSVPIVTLVFGEKWNESLGLFYLFVLPNLFLPSLQPLISVFNALGRSKVPLRLSFAILVVTWGLGLPLVHVWGVYGFAVAYVIAQAMHWFLLKWLNDELAISVERFTLSPWLAALVVGIAVALWQMFYGANSLLSVLGAVVGGAILYVLVVPAFCRVGMRSLLTAAKSGVGGI